MATATNVGQPLLRVIDPPFAQTLLSILGNTGLMKERRLREVGEQVVQWLSDHGKFLRANVTDDLYYLWTDEHRVFRLDSDHWKHWLYQLSTINPSNVSFKFLQSDCQTAALDGERVDICRLAHWDGQFLRVSSFDGQVWRLDGQSIERENNGDGPILFDDPKSWATYEPDFQADSAQLGWWTRLVNVEEPIEDHRFALLIYAVAMFFSELCPTRPVLMLRGEAGSGKSMTLRVLERLLFGASTELSGMPDKPDGFTAMAAGSHLMVLDNLDETDDWIRDKLARMTTGAIDHYRKLYTSNELGTVTYRVWVAITARTPDVLRRDDLVDRLLIIPAKRLEDDKADDGQWERESLFLDDASRRRAQFWGALLNVLNAVVAELRIGGMPRRSTMRMADFECLGRVIARSFGKESLWDQLTETWQREQAAFLQEGSLIIDAIEEWLKDPLNRWREVDSRTLYSECELKLFGSSRPERGWPRSSRSFGRQLATMRRGLEDTFRIEWEERSRRTYYRIDVQRGAP